MKNSNTEYVGISFLMLKKSISILLDNGKLATIGILLMSMILGVLPSISLRTTQNIINALNDPLKSLIYILVNVIIYILIDLLVYALSNLQSFIIDIFRQKINLNVNLSILEKIVSLTLEDFENTEIYNKIKRAQSQSNNTILDYYLQFILVIQKCITLIAMGAIIIEWNFWVIIVIVFISSIQMIYMLNLNREQYDMVRSRTQNERRKMYYEFILSNDIAFKEIKVFGIANFFISKYKKISKQIILQDRKMMKKMISFRTLAGFGHQIFIGCMFLKMAVDTYERRIFVGDMMAYIKGLSSVKASVEGIFLQWESINQMALYMQMLFELLDIDEREFTDKQILQDNIQSIELVNVSFKYNNAKEYALKNINLKIKKGDKIAIIGRNGSGKSTLVKLIAGLYDSYEGTILVNGIDRATLQEKNFYNKIGILFQDFTKFELTLKENVGISQLSKLDQKEKIKQVLTQANVKIKRLDNLDQQLGYWFDNGTQLSGGEWLKIAIARAFFGEKEIYILDEPNSALDTIATKEVMKNIELLFKDKIGLMVCHKLEMVKNFDSIILLEDGMIVNDGTYNELMSNSESFKALYNE